MFLCNYLIVNHKVTKNISLLQFFLKFSYIELTLYYFWFVHFVRFPWKKIHYPKYIGNEQEKVVFMLLPTGNSTKNGFNNCELRGITLKNEFYDWELWGIGIKNNFYTWELRVTAIKQLFCDREPRVTVSKNQFLHLKTAGNSTKTRFYNREQRGMTQSFCFN